MKKLKNILMNIYGAEFIDSYEKEYGKEGVHELARRTAKNGVCFKTPVFDGANFENDIKPLLEELRFT